MLTVSEPTFGDFETGRMPQEVQDISELWVLFLFLFIWDLMRLQQFCYRFQMQNCTLESTCSDVIALYLVNVY